jgi:hypothetical protein
MYEWFGVRCPSDEKWNSFARRFDKIKAMRQDVSTRVLGHQVNDDDWMIFDEMLDREYSEMKRLLTLLDGE